MLELKWNHVGPRRGDPAPSELKEISDPRRHAVVGGTWYATNWLFLRTMQWTDAGWRETVGEEAIKGMFPLDGDRLGGIVGTPKGLVGVSHEGAVFRLAGDRYETLAKAQSVFKKRYDFILLHDGANDRLVVWGGDVKDRRMNDTLFFDGTRWTKAKSASPVPKDFAPDYDIVTFTAVYDTALGRALRFGWEEVFVLEGEVWQPYAPKEYKTWLGRFTSFGHFPVHDPATGETLLIDFEKRRVVRFDLDSCAEVATFEYPIDVVQKAESERRHVHVSFHRDAAFDPGTRTFHSQHEDDTWGRYALDLSPAFEAARALGPRTRPAPAQAAMTTNGGPTHLYRFAGGKLSHSTAGGFFAAIQKWRGFVPANELAPEVLQSVGTRKSSALSVVERKPASSATSRVGGLPSGVTVAKWPKAEGGPMGFLFQLVTGNHLAKHAGLAVFCALDGSATEGEGQTCVVLLDREDLERPGLAQAPPGVPVLPERAIEVAAPRLEIDEDVVAKLADRDAAIGARFDELQASAPFQEGGIGSKLGGTHRFLQNGQAPKGSRFVAQLDVDALDLDEWPDAGLVGRVYVFAASDEKSAFAVWQYT
jgi:hypothetical protein